MSRDMDRLREALKDMPGPDAGRKAAILASARENFAASQELTEPARPISERPHVAGRVWRGVFKMISMTNSRPAILTGISLSVVVLSVVVGWQFWGFRDTVGPVPELRSMEQVADLMVEADEAAAREAAARHSNNTPMVMGALEKSAVVESSLMSISSAPYPEMSLSSDFAAGARFPEFVQGGLKVTAAEPVSTFSIDVDTASYALWRMSVLDGYPLPENAIRIEEMVNYFDYSFPRPDNSEVPFTVAVSVTRTPWNDGTRLMQIGIQGYDVPAAELPPMGLVFLIDTSGSMDDPMKLPLLIRSFSMLLSTLSGDDTVAIVTYAGSAGIVLEPTPAVERDAILAALERLDTGGRTAGQAGLQQAYSIAETMVATGRSARVILATDGDFNVGISDPEMLKDFVAEKRKSGVALSVLGFGRGNYSDATMQALAQNGNGVAAYIDSLAEARKVLVEDVAGSLMTIATDVKIQVEFNPAMISEYRLLGYETRALDREEFNDDSVDAGDIGAGHSVTAIYEITPKGSAAELTDPLRYQSAGKPVSDEYAFLKLRYKRPGEEDSQLVTTPVHADTSMIGDDDANFAAAVTGAARLIRGESLGRWTLKDAAALTSRTLGPDPFGYRAEFLRLLQLAEAQPWE